MSEVWRIFRPKNLYVLVPEKDFVEGDLQTDGNVSSEGVESRRSIRRKAALMEGENASPSKGIEVRTGE